MTRAYQHHFNYKHDPTVIYVEQNHKVDNTLCLSGFALPCYQHNSQSVFYEAK